MPDADDEWRFALEDLPDPDAEGDGDGDGDADDGGNVAGSVADLDAEVEPGSPTLEGAAFVLLGALAAVVFLLAMVGYI